jgi:pre-mRNA-splicing helicase BRR2
MSETQMMDVARFCNSYPGLDLEFKIEDENEIVTEDAVTLLIDIEREVDDEDEDEDDEGETKMNDVDPNTSYASMPVHAPLYPKEKMEGWWLLLGNMKDDTVAAIKRVTVKVKSSFRLEFEAPEKPGTYEYKLYLICDAYLGCDQEYDVKIVVNEGSNSSDDDAEVEDENETRT